MHTKTFRLLALGLAALLASCSSPTGGSSANNTVDPTAIFTDDYGSGLSYASFGGIDGQSVDTTVAHSGTASLKIVIPAKGWTGGAIVASAARDLSGYNAVSFWVKGSAAFTFEKFGVGNDATPAGSTLSAEVISQIAVTTGTSAGAMMAPRLAQCNGGLHATRKYTKSATRSSTILRNADCADLSRLRAILLRLDGRRAGARLLITLDAFAS